MTKYVITVFLYLIAQRRGAETFYEMCGIASSVIKHGCLEHPPTNSWRFFFRWEKCEAHFFEIFTHGIQKNDHLMWFFGMLMEQ